MKYPRLLFGFLFLKEISPVLILSASYELSCFHFSQPLFARLLVFSSLTYSDPSCLYVHSPPIFFPLYILVYLLPHKFLSCIVSQFAFSKEHYFAAPILYSCCFNSTNSFDFKTRLMILKIICILAEEFLVRGLNL